MNQTILVSSVLRQREAHKTAVQLRSLVEWVNKIYSETILSPFTTIAGDEFQGIVSTPARGMDIILAIEEYVVEEEFDFKLKYVLESIAVGADYSKEDTYALMGDALSKAREQLRMMKKDRQRFLINTDKAIQLNKMMKITQRFIDGWYDKDKTTVTGFLQGRDYKEMSRLQHKDSSSLWRKRKSLAIDEYLLCKEMIHHLMED